MKYDCVCNIGSRKTHWTADISPIAHKRAFYKVTISGRGSSFHVIAGPQSNGYFLCIPDWQIGFEIKSYDDVIGNTLVLGSRLSPVDTVTVTDGLTHLQDAFNKQHALL